MSYYFRRSVLTLIWLTVALLLLVSLISYSVNDPSWSHRSSVVSPVSNLAGTGGAWLADILYTFLGAASWWLVIIACYEGWRVWHDRTVPQGALRSLGYIFLIIATAALTGLMTLSWLKQGILGQLVGQGLSGMLTLWGARLFVWLFVLLTLTFTFNVPWRRLWTGQLGKKSQSNQSDSATPQPLNTAKENPKSEPAPQLPLTLEGEIDATHASRQAMLDNLTHADPSQPAEHYHSDSPFDAFLNESGFSRAKDYELDEADATSPFKPVSAEHIANTKLTKKLDARLQGETIRPPKPMPTPNNVKIPETLQPNVAKNPTVESVVETVAQPVNESLTRPPSNSPDITEPVAQPIVEPLHDVNVNSTDDNEVVNELDGLDGLKDLADSLTAKTPVQPTTEPSEQPNTDIEVATGATETPTPTVHSFEPTAPLEPTDTNEHPTEDPAPVTIPTASRSVEVDELKPVTLEELDIHNDAAFAGKSRAMQTAAYRASLSPLPDFSLLELPDPNRKPSYSREELQQLSELLEIKLQEFNVKAQVVNAQLGPVVTRFEVELAPGIKASKVTGIARDLARSMSMASVRVVEVIPGKPYIGIEVPNPHRQMVRLIELLQTDAYRDPNGMISMAMGKDIAGKPIITDLARAPHMLVAGTTGSGKSVLVNSLLLSMLLKYTPEQLRLILIDPKQLELANYNDIPHLLTPVVTDMTEAASALSWCVAEMERRYQLMSLFKVRKLDEFNKKVIASQAQGHPLLDPLWRIHDSVSQDKPPQLKPLPQIVIVADEFADMIMQVGKQAEELITRLAQKSRAAGIHLILATQRPSVDVITGLIKANIPVRAALRVNSKVDSRTILDAGGAEDMLGHGDMLFLAPGQNEPTRVHGAFISDGEVNAICDAWRERGAPEYIDNIFDNFELSSPSGGGGDGGIATGDEDALYDEVVAFVLETRKVSASSIQRKFSIGYNRAARIVDAMEEAGLVSGMGKSGKRELLV